MDELIELNVRWAVAGIIQPFESDSRPDVEAFLRVLAGPGGRYSMSPHPIVAGEYGVMVADVENRPVAIIDLKVTQPDHRPRAAGRGLTNWFGE